MQAGFEDYRALLFSIAYRMTGSVMEAEDIVQETYLRYHATPQETIRSPKNFLCTVTTRLCINHLNSARVQREAYMGPWLPEPILTGTDGAVMPAPAEDIGRYETLSVAFLVLLESLTPAERAVFLLREVFDYDYAEIALIVEKNETACRQLFSRAKKRIVEQRPRFDVSPDAHQEILDQFVRAAEFGELEGMMNLLAQDVALWADGGGQVYGAATRLLQGPHHVASFILGSFKFLPQHYTLENREINGQPGVIVRSGASVLGVLTLEPGERGVRAVHFVGNPDKLKRL